MLQHRRRYFPDSRSRKHKNDLIFRIVPRIALIQCAIEQAHTARKQMKNEVALSSRTQADHILLARRHDIKIIALEARMQPKEQRCL